ncbi:MAG: hypothetical protein IJT19_08710 [Bacteroidaceae bacterium]|nr:hypothetical protein [Bacteroidaceae bacterium]
MRNWRTSRYISAVALISLCCLTVSASEKKEPVPKAPLFCGAAVFADLSGPVMKAVGARFDQLEVGARLNFRDHYFPICELGIGESDREGRENNNKFHARAPYYRVGMDYNLNRKHNGNRLMVGLRYGFSSFKYDFSDPDFSDPVWQGAGSLNLKNMKGQTGWLEACIGCETKLWSFIRLGWNIRYKVRLHQSANPSGEPYYTPGFGKNGSNTFGGTLNLIFDVGKTTKKKTAVEQITETINK